MTTGVFITATDTGAGKTLVSQALLLALARRGRRVAGMKPVASGCEMTPAGLRSADALALLAAGNIAADYAEVNPYAFAPATAPHLAAAAAGVPIQVETILGCYQRLAARAECVVVEGIGGWLVPIDARLSMADVAVALGLPVVLVVGLRLGVLNHALLTRAAVLAHGCRLAGWVANHPQGAAPEGYLEALTVRLDAPCLGVIPPQASTPVAAHCLAPGLASVLTGYSES
jgi:dethiobiotin synthetase